MKLWHHLQKFYPKDGDLVLISDVDEIPTRKGMEYMLEHPPIYYYTIHAVYNTINFMYKTPEKWHKSTLLRYNSQVKAKDFQTFRDEVVINLTEPVATHCTCCFNDLDNYTRKYKSFSHQELNRHPFINESYVFRSHYCRKSYPFDIKLTRDMKNFYDEDLIPDDPRLEFLINPKFKLDISRTIYKEEDLKDLCNEENDWWEEKFVRLKPKYQLQ
ncbi:hypothetical protein TVAG_183750 [Trichomonas vaginalis G3]|uniref:Glycosyltransferase family 17 protein n=1 Tax=Trichomonas vaginalis (strain ATCC PRA-98 / G3) TaxID=412133 RepID=A2D9B2_TRIV3|nr:beta-1,4-mannosyl-glycoprotein beta-1,4-n-acetylglucosaminyl-transferase family [Trichomonas vaginalis G3]EAY23138.1 hypothetical protein TVAG_183750 [Trichomonas vaginalis G3]KAI5513795.1 beta-1,4-mannosyl-glycoprotein beta-1,4-n-acetylglucosaminyl-transferase family [Trichomonas vaginalis G3]|eukprot:XP_001584124.1 hypothetical protein [Trichomonas vaginalis G3]